MKTVIISESLYNEVLKYFGNRAEISFAGGYEMPNEERELLLKLNKEFEQYNGITAIPY